MKNKFFVSSLVFVFIATSQSLAQTATGTATNSGSAAAPSTTQSRADAYGAAANTAAGSYTPTTYSTPSVNQSATSSKSNNQMGGQMAMMVAVLLTPKLTESIHVCQSGVGSWACPLIPVLGMMIMSASNQAKDNFAAADAANTSMGATNGYGDDSASNIGAEKQAEQILGKNYDLTPYKNLVQKLETTGVDGYKYDSKSGTLMGPGGKKLSGSDLSPGGLAAAGLSQKAIDEALKDLKDANATAKKYVDKYGSSFDDGGGGGSGSKLATTPEDSSGRQGLPGNLLKDREPSSMAGLSKTLNGEPIGVAQDNLFGMMTRRYKLKEKQDSFY